MVPAIAVLVAVVLAAAITWPCAIGYREKGSGEPSLAMQRTERERS